MIYNFDMKRIIMVLILAVSLPPPKKITAVFNNRSSGIGSTQRRLSRRLTANDANSHNRANNAKLSIGDDAVVGRSVWRYQLWPQSANLH